MIENEQNAIVHNLFPIPLFETLLNKELICDEIKLILSKIKNKNLLHSNGNSGNFITNDSFVLDEWNLVNLKENITYALDYFAKEVLNYEYDLIYITQSWINVNPSKSFHHPHKHTNSILSGVFYIQTSENCGEIYFHRPEKSIEPSVKFEENNYYTWDAKYFSPVDNQLLIFPSDLFHSVSSNLTKNTNRISLSFNTFISPIGSKSSKTFLSYR